MKGLKQSNTSNRWRAIKPFSSIILPLSLLSLLKIEHCVASFLAFVAAMTAAALNVEENYVGHVYQNVDNFRDLSLSKQ